VHGWAVRGRAECPLAGYRCPHAGRGRRMLGDPWDVQGAQCTSRWCACVRACVALLPLLPNLPLPPWRRNSGGASPCLFQGTTYPCTPTHPYPSHPYPHLFDAQPFLRRARLDEVRHVGRCCAGALHRLPQRPAGQQLVEEVGGGLALLARRPGVAAAAAPAAWLLLLSGADDRLLPFLLAGAIPGPVRSSTCKR